MRLQECFDCFVGCVYCEYVLTRSLGRITMTLPAHSVALGSRLPSADEKAIANQLRRILAAQMTDEGVKIRVRDPAAPKHTAEITLTPGLADLLLELLRHIGKGDAVTLVPISQMLTTQQAADVLNVSRPFLISLLDKGEIGHELVGRHRRIKAENLFAYKAGRDRKRREALSELAAIDADLI
jgi:excisionase family DNA binding protein